MAAEPDVHSGPPYIPNVAGVGGRPTVNVDVPILAVYLGIYIIGAVSYMTILQLNQRKGHKFFIIGPLFGFCMARIVTAIMRIAWATRPSNASIAIASQIFTNAGVLILYLVTLLLTQRLFRSLHPTIGWNRYLNQVLKVMYVLLGISLALVIAFTVLSFYTLNMGLRNAARYVQRGAVTYQLLFNIISTVLYLWSVLLAPAKNSEEFGVRGALSKKIILGLAIFFCDFIIGFRTGVTWSTPRPAADPAWYDSKEAFYIIELGFEIVVLYVLLLARIDKRFWVPNGSKQPGDYSAPLVDEKPNVLDSTS